jgi:CBS domain-containing protein
MVVQVPPEMSIWQAATLMERRGVKRLPVVDEEDYLLGIISRADLVKAMARNDKQIRAEVLETINVLGPETIEGLDVEVTDGMAVIQGVADRGSTQKLAVKLAGRVPGVVGVIDRMTSVTDTARLPRPRGGENYPKDPRLDWLGDTAGLRGAR